MTSGRGGYWGSRFCGFGPFFPQFFGGLDFETQFCGFLQHCGLRLLVVIVGGLRFADVVHGFFGSFITRTLHAALQCYTDIVVSVFNNNYFGRGFAVFGAFCCGFAVFAIPPQCPPPGTDHHCSTKMNYKA